MKNRGMAPIVVSLMVLMAFIAGGCGPAEPRAIEVAESPEPGSPEKENLEPISAAVAAQPTLGYLQKVDGLHVTGVMKEIDIATFRLAVTGRVDNPLSLTFDDVKGFPAVDRKATLECPGYFVDQGVWTGVPLKTILDLAEVEEGATMVVFREVEGGYAKKLPVDVARRDGVMVSYRFDGREFPPVHGYPLRMVVDGEAGAFWVKWLGEIQIE